MDTHCHQGCSKLMWSETAGHKPLSALGSQIRSSLRAKLLKCCMEPITVIMPTTAERNVRLQDYITAFSKNTRVSRFCFSKSTSVRFLPPLQHCSHWTKREVNIAGDGSLWPDRAPSLDPPKPTEKLAPFTDVHAALMGADMLWRSTTSQSTLLASPTFTILQKHPAGRGPLFSANIADMWKEADASAEKTMAILKWARSVQHWCDR